MPKFTSNTIQLHIIKFDSKANEFRQLILKRSPDTKPYPSMWQVVTGRLEAQETAFEAALRELKEETSLEPMKFWTLPFVASFFNTLKDELSFAPVFVCEVSELSEVIISEEHSEWLWIDLAETSNYIKLPSHIEGTKCVEDFVINNDENFHYQIEKSLWEK